METLRDTEEEVFETPDIEGDDSDGSVSRLETRKESVVAANKVADAEMMTASIPPRAAFEVFMGKVYTGVEEDLSDSIAPADSSSRNKGGWYGAVFAAADGKGGAGVESPMERLLRLRAEADQLVEDLDEMTK
ncbi:unnamed protein product, partial [Choristocarpus tenellus]